MITAESNNKQGLFNFRNIIFDRIKQIRTQTTSLSRQSSKNTSRIGGN